MIRFVSFRLLEFNPPYVSENPLDLVVAEPGDPDKAGTILAVGSDLGSQYPHATIVRPNPAAHGAAFISPGLVCAHTHIYSALARGLQVNIAPSRDFTEVLQNLWWRLDRAIDEDILEASSLFACSEAVAAGVTTLVDHHASPEFIDGSLSVIAKAFDKIGLRGLLCYETTDRGGMGLARAGIAENVRFAKECAGTGTSNKSAATRLTAATIGAHAGFTVGEESLELLGEAVRSTGLGLHIHLAEDIFDTVYSRFAHKTDLVRRLEKTGCLGPKTIIGHGVHLCAQDIDLLNANKCYLAHNARSNMNNAVGYATQLSTFERVVLGTDGMSTDMLEEFKFAVFRHRESKGPWWPDNFLRCLDRNNRIVEEYFGVTAGGLKPGNVADLVLWDYSAPTPVESANLAGHLAFGLNSRSVESVMVGGKFLIRNKEVQWDLEKIAQQAQAQTRRLWKRMETR